MKQDMKEFMAKVSEDEGLRVKLEALAGLPDVFSTVSVDKIGVMISTK